MQERDPKPKHVRTASGRTALIWTPMPYAKLSIGCHPTAHRQRHVDRRDLESMDRDSDHGSWRGTSSA